MNWIELTPSIRTAVYSISLSTPLDPTPSHPVRCRFQKSGGRLRPTVGPTALHINVQYTLLYTYCTIHSTYPRWRVYNIVLYNVWQVGETVSYFTNTAKIPNPHGLWNLVANLKVLAFFSSTNCPSWKNGQENPELCSILIWSRSRMSYLDTLTILY